MTATNTTSSMRFRTRCAAMAQRFVSDSSGAPAIEYIVAAALLGLGVLAGVDVLSSAVTELYNSVIDQFGR